MAEMGLVCARSKAKWKLLLRMVRRGRFRRIQ